VNNFPEDTPPNLLNTTFDYISKYHIIFISYYTHLDNVFVKPFQSLGRGDKIGIFPSWSKYVQLMFHSREVWIDPDNYGLNHSYMEYANAVLDVDEELMINPELVELRYIRQKQIRKKFDRLRINPEYNCLRNKYHVKNGNRLCHWSNLVKFRYLDFLYEKKPELFTSLSLDEYQAIKEEFYKNQPIILTLPMKKKS